MSGDGIAALSDEIRSFCGPLCGPEDTVTAQAADYALQALDAAVALADRVEAAEALLENPGEAAKDLLGRVRAAEARVSELEEALQDAKTTIRKAQMRYEHPLVEHPWGRCGCVSCEGIRAINAALSSPPPTETNQRA